MRQWYKNELPCIFLTRDNFSDTGLQVFHPYQNTEDVVVLVTGFRQNHSICSHRLHKVMFLLPAFFCFWVLLKTSHLAHRNWLTGVRWAVSKLDPRRLEPLSSLLLSRLAFLESSVDEPLSVPSLIHCKVLQFISSLLVELNWRGASLARRFVPLIRIECAKYLLVNQSIRSYCLYEGVCLSLQTGSAGNSPCNAPMLQEFVESRTNPRVG